LAQIFEHRKSCPHPLQLRVAGRGLFQEPFDPGSGSERAPDGEELFRKKTGPFGAGVGEERAQFEGSRNRKRSLFLEDPGGFDRFPEELLDRRSFSEGPKREAESLPDLDGGKGLQGLQKREKF
jgi:hypothetical protein